jgi:hypothetical protein
MATAINMLVFVVRLSFVFQTFLYYLVSFYFIANFSVEWFAFLLCILEVTGTNLKPEINHCD